MGQENPSNIIYVLHDDDDDIHIRLRKAIVSKKFYIKRALKNLI